MQVTDGLLELKNVDRASVYEAGKDLAGAAVRVLARGLTLPYREVGGWVLLRSSSACGPSFLRQVFVLPLPYLPTYVSYATRRTWKETSYRFPYCDSPPDPARNSKLFWRAWLLKTVIVVL